MVQQLTISKFIAKKHKSCLDRKGSLSAPMNRISEKDLRGMKALCDQNHGKPFQRDTIHLPRLPPHLAAAKGASQQEPRTVRRKKAKQMPKFSN